MSRVLPTRGKPSVGCGHLGVWLLSLGPNTSCPGERLQVVILNETGEVVRRLEQIQGNCLDQGYVDFFNSYRCRPTQYEYSVVDMTPDGQVVFSFGSLGPNDLRNVLPGWAAQFGNPAWAF